MLCDKLQRHSVRGVMYNGEEICGGFSYYDADEVDAAIEELKQKLEDAKATAYAEIVDAGMENRRLKRALWLARAISAINAVGEIHNVIVCMRERNPKMSLSNTEAQEQVWKNVARKCRAKAEGYK